MALIPTRSETLANWTTSNTILAMNEVAIESDTGTVKVGDGKTAYLKLGVSDVQQTSAQRAALISDETGTGLAVYSTSPTFTTPTLGVAGATSINKVTITAPTTSATLTLVTGSSLVTAGAFAVTLTSTATTGVTLPTTGTLATLAGTETLSGKTLASPKYTGVIGANGAAPTIASATTIAPTVDIIFVSGVTTIQTITAPVSIDTLGGRITIIPTGIFLTGVAGNIALASTSVVSKSLTMTYDPTTLKWYPSY